VWAIDALCVMNHPRAPEIARTSLAASNQPVKRRVLKSCVPALNSAAGHRALLDVALHDEDLALAISARLNLVRYLQGQGGSESLAAEIRTAAAEELNREGGDTLRAALLLGELRDPRATTRLIEALGDSNPYARDHAALVLGRIGDPRAVAPLIDVLDDKLPMVRATVHNSLAWFAADGNEQARAAVESYTGPKFSRPVPR
jgi:HEAT repeat protein